MTVDAAMVKRRCPATSGWEDADVTALIAANTEFLNDRVGVGLAEGDDDVTFTIRDALGRMVLLLPMKLLSITSVIEHYLWQDPSENVTLAADDYDLSPGGTAITRRLDGTNQRDGWSDEVIIAAKRTSGGALYDQILVQLCCLDATMGSDPTLTEQRLGDYSEQRASSTQNTLVDQKEAIVGQLTATALPVFS